MSRIKIAIVDDSREFCSLVRQYCKAFEDIEFVGAAHNGYDGLELIEKKQPDAVIVDSVMPDLDGIGMLKRIPKLNIDKVPDIVFVTEYHPEGVMDNAEVLGISYIMFRKNDIDEIVDRCKMAVAASKKRAHKKEPDFVMEDLVTSYIQNIGIPANVKGYHFLRSAILIVSKNPMKGTGITKDLYPQIAKMYNTTASKVERNIRNAIEIAFDRGNKETYARIFSGTIKQSKGRPTNSEFISLISEKVVHDMRRAMTVY